MDNCIFCNIINKKTPSYTIYEDDYLIAILDINPSIPGHIVLILKTHYGSLKEVNDNEVGHLLIIAKKLSNFLTKILNVGGTSIFIADGELAGQKAPHTLMHILPRIENDTINLNLPEKNYDEVEITKVKEKILFNIIHDFKISEDEIKTWNEVDSINSNSCKICNVNTENSIANIIYKDNDLIAFLPKNACTPYHIQIAPRMHYSALGLVPDSLSSKLLLTAKKLSITIAKTFDCNSCNFLLRNGIPAGQKDPHIILDLIPRIPSDNINLNWEPKQADNNLLAQLALALKGEADGIISEDETKIVSSNEQTPQLNAPVINKNNQENGNDDKDYLMDSLNKRA